MQSYYLLCMVLLPSYSPKFLAISQRVLILFDYFLSLLIIVLLAL